MKIFLLLFLEGIFAFASPCILPLLPIYLIYLAGGEEQKGKRLLFNTLGFILGFTVIFMALGVTATFVGRYLQAHRVGLLRLGGIFTFFLGLYYALQGQSWFRLPSFPLFQRLFQKRGESEASSSLAPQQNLRFVTSFFFGMAFCSAWTPCLATWLASALTLSANAQTWHQGAVMLFVFSMGLGLPFLACAFAFQRLRSTFRFLQRNSQRIRLVAGGLLMLLGLFMCFGAFSAYLGLFQ